MEGKRGALSEYASLWAYMASWIYVSQKVGTGFILVFHN